MVRTYVVINDWCHKLLREAMQRTPLVAEGGTVSYRIRPEYLPESYFSLAACHTLDGLPLEQVRSGCWQVREGCKAAVLQAVGGIDATRLDRRCWRDLRMRSGEDPLGLFSGELLVFGTGTLRRSTPSIADGRICSHLEQISAQIWALGTDAPEADSPIQKQVFDSTNVIYGDVFGELEQLWSRRADIHFLDAVARSLETFRRWRRLPVSDHPPLNVPAVMELHLKSQAVWRTPPRNGRALLKRLEFILESSILDNSAVTARSVAAWRNANPRSGNRPRLPRNDS